MYRSLATPSSRLSKLQSFRALHSSTVTNAGDNPLNAKLPRHSDDYIPGSANYAYENPWPAQNKGRLDWLFGDGWRRPLNESEGLYKRKQWISFGFDTHDEYEDWTSYHTWMLGLVGGLAATYGWMFMFAVPDWPEGRDWMKREAYIELERRREAGLPLVSPHLLDPERVKAQLPPESDLKNFDIII